MSVHFAQSGLTACGKDIIAGWKEKILQHTTLKKSVTCKSCKKIISKKSSLKDYLSECEEENKSAEDEGTDYYDDDDY